MDSLINFIILKPGEKTPFQLVCTPTLAMRLTSETDYQAKTKNSIRGAACLGSTDEVI